MFGRRSQARRLGATTAWVFLGFLLFVPFCHVRTGNPSFPSVAAVQQSNHTPDRFFPLALRWRELIFCAIRLAARAIGPASHIADAHQHFHPDHLYLFMSLQL